MSAAWETLLKIRRQWMVVSRAFKSRYFGADRHARRGGRGAQWSGDACVALASPMGGRCEAAGEQDAGRPKGPHPSSLPPPPLRDEPASLLVSQTTYP